MDNTKRTTTSWTIQCIRHREHDSPYKQRVHSMACVPLAAHAAVLDALSECGRDGFAVFKTLSYCGRGGFASLPVGLGGTQEGDGRLGVAGRRWMGALRGAGPPPHRSDSGQTAAKRPPTLGRSGQIAASRGLAAVQHISRREASLLVSQGATPLHQATKQGHTAIAEALMAKGADVNAKNVSGRGREPWRRMGGRAAGQNHVREQATRGGAAE